MSSVSFQMKGAAYRKTLIKRFAICCTPRIFTLSFQNLLGMAEVVKRGRSTSPVPWANGSHAESLYGAKGCQPDLLRIEKPCSKTGVIQSLLRKH